MSNGEGLTLGPPEDDDKSVLIGKLEEAGELDALYPGRAPLSAIQVAREALVIRGYLGPSDARDRALELLKRMKPDAVRQAVGSILDEAGVSTAAEIAEQVEAVSDAKITEIVAGLLTSAEEDAATMSWRLYLSPKLDRYIEFSGQDVVALREETEPEREDVYTVWLRHNELPYMVVAPLQSATGFVRGDLVEDFMQRPESRAVVWEEQGYGLARPKTGPGCGGPYT